MDLRRPVTDPPGELCPRTLKSAAKPWRGSGLFVIKNQENPPVRRVQISLNQFTANFFHFWQTILIDKIPIVQSRSAVASPQTFSPLKKSTKKVYPNIVSLKSLLKKSISKMCRWTSDRLRQCGQSSTDEVRWDRDKG